MGLIEAIMDIPAEQQSNVFGQFDAYAKKIERTLHVTPVSYTHLDVYKRQSRNWWKKAITTTCALPSDR